MRGMFRSLLAGLAAAAIVLACAATASADSIAYIKEGNVWLTTPDGARQFQVTTAGGYSDVTQSDDGTIVALNGVRLHKLARDGAVLADFATPVSDTRPAGSKQFWGPYDPAISPDGTKVAYTYYWLSQTTTPNCFPPKCLVALERGRHGLHVVGPHDRLEDRRRDRLPLRLAPPVVGRQRHDAARQPDPHAQPRPAAGPHLRRRQRQGQHGHGLVQRRGRQPAHERRRGHARQAQARRPDRRERQHADGLHGPRLPERVEGRQPDRLRRGPLLPLLGPRGRRLRAAVVVARRVAHGLPRRRRA